jgi:hypothetical protein
MAGEGANVFSLYHVGEVVGVSGEFMGNPDSRESINAHSQQLQNGQREPRQRANCSRPLSKQTCLRLSYSLKATRQMIAEMVGV